MISIKPERPKLAGDSLVGALGIHRSGTGNCRIERHGRDHPIKRPLADRKYRKGADDDIEKNSFHVVRLDRCGAIVLRGRVRRLMPILEEY
jgi:hypothetical protein